MAFAIVMSLTMIGGLLAKEPDRLLDVCGLSKQGEWVILLYWKDPVHIKKPHISFVSDKAFVKEFYGLLSATSAQSSVSVTTKPGISRFELIIKDANGRTAILAGDAYALYTPIDGSVIMAKDKDGDPHVGIDRRIGELRPLLEWISRALESAQ